MSPEVRREAVEVLFGRDHGIIAVIDALESRAMTVSELDPARQARLRTHANVAIRTRAQGILGTETSASRDRSPVIASYRPALALVGNHQQGRETFVKIRATATRPRAAASTSVPTSRRSRAAHRRIFSSISSTQTERLRRTT